MVTLSTSGPSSTLRVYAWRKLRAVGAYALAPSVYLLPDRPATAGAATRLLARAEEDEGGRGRALRIRLANRDEEREMIAAFRAERSDEYAEIVERSKELLAELAMETVRGRTTFTEVDESAADLGRFQRWLDAVRQRDYFDSEGRTEAERAVEVCERALGDFEAAAYESEVREAQSSAQARRLRAVDSVTDRRA
jgi:hypothetical protein